MEYQLHWLIFKILEFFNYKVWFWDKLCIIVVVFSLYSNNSGVPRQGPHLVSHHPKRVGDVGVGYGVYDFYLCFFV